MKMLGSQSTLFLKKLIDGMCRHLKSNEDYNGL